MEQDKKPSYKEALKEAKLYDKICRKLHRCNESSSFYFKQLDYYNGLVMEYRKEQVVKLKTNP